MSKNSPLIRTGLSQTTASIQQRKNGNGPVGRRINKFGLIYKSAAVILIWSGFSALGAVYNSDGTATSVQYLHDNFARDGDTITLPVGTSMWLATIAITKAITLQGSGVGNTIVSDAGSGNLINWTLVASEPSRMTGIEFRDGGRSVAAWGNSIYGSNTNGSTMRIDHCKFDHLIGFAINPNDCIGVIDHNTFLAAVPNIPIYAMHKNWNDQGPFAGG